MDKVSKFELQRTKRRKTISIEVSDTKNVIVRAPYHLSIKRIEEIVEKHKNWIKKKQAEVYFVPHKYSEGESFLYLGKFYPLELTDNNLDILYFDNKKFMLNNSNINKANLLFKNWYKTESKKLIELHIGYYAKLMNVKYHSFRITWANKRWGSCSSQKKLSFSWRISMLPTKLIEYIVVHELAHIKEMNHGPNFWKIVKSFCPKYKERLKWLKVNRAYTKL